MDPIRRYEQAHEAMSKSNKPIQPHVLRDYLDETRRRRRSAVGEFFSMKIVVTRDSDPVLMNMLTKGYVRPTAELEVRS